MSGIEYVEDQLLVGLYGCVRDTIESSEASVPWLKYERFVRKKKKKTETLTLRDQS
jgi:hypothetical protein